MKIDEIEIKTAFEQIGEEKAFVVYLRNKDKWSNCAFTDEILKDSYSALEGIKSALDALFFKVFPEFKLDRLKDELQSLETRKSVIEKLIRMQKESLFNEE